MIELNRLAEVFKEKKVSNRLIADFMGNKEETVSRWCNNRQQPSLADLNKIAEFLRVDIRSLFYPSNWPETGTAPYRTYKIGDSKKKD